MATSNVVNFSAHDTLQLRTRYFEPHWYSAYTCANHEKCVAEQLERRGIEHYLPLYETVHRWKDRRKRLKLPLFPGYVFIRLALSEKLRVLEVPSVVRLVGFGDFPEPLPETEMDLLRKGLADRSDAQPHPYLTTGRRVRIKGGPLAGMEGILLRRKGNFRVVISVDLIMRSIVVDIDAADVLPLNTAVRSSHIQFQDRT